MEKQPSLPPIAWPLLVLLMAAKFLIHAATAGSYGYFRDELYFLDCARHLQWGYVDDTPGIVAVFKVALWLGGSLPVVRLLAALGGAATVATGPLLAREFGGGWFAQGFAGLCLLAAPIFLGMDSILCVGVLEPLAWMGCALFLTRAARTGEGRHWLGFGLAAGLGIQIKYTMLVVLACFLAAILLTPLRRELRRKAFWAGVALALAIALPTLLWQVRNHYPLLVDMENIRRTGKNVVLAPWPFLRQQILILDPMLLPVWGGGLVWLLRNRTLRALGLFYLLLLGALMALHGKDYYLAAAYPLLFAAGAVALEKLVHRTWALAALAGVVAATLPPLALLLLPFLPPAGMLAWQARLGVTPARAETGHVSLLDQRLADQFGWEELARETAAIYQSLPPAERATAGIFAGNYGEAGAIDQFGPALGLPPAICGHNAHSFWGPPAREPGTIICLGSGREGLERAFDSVTEAAVHQHPWGMAEENRPIYVCRGLHGTIRERWPEITHWN